MKAARLVCLLLSFALTARSAEPPPNKTTDLSPTLPLKRAPDFARWVVTTDLNETDSKVRPTQKTKASQPNRTADAGKPTTPEVTVVKTRQIIHVESVDDRGTTANKWCVGDLQVTTRPEWKEPLVSIGANPYDGAYTDFSKTDFPELNWVSAKNYIRFETVNDRACCVFKDRINVSAKVPGQPESSQEANGESATVDAPRLISAEAWVDYYSRLPIRLVWGDETHHYRFELPPEVMLVIPENVNAAIATRKEQTRELQRKPAGP